MAYLLIAGISRSLLVAMKVQEENAKGCLCYTLCRSSPDSTAQVGWEGTGEQCVSASILRQQNCQPEHSSVTKLALPAPLCLAGGWTSC